MIDLKTGYLIGLSAELGSMITEAKKEESILLRDFGRKIGRAFQIKDDILEIFSDTQTMGKSLKSDLILEKKTFLMVKGENYNPGFMEEVKSIISKDYESGIIKIRDILVNNHIYEEANHFIKSNLEDASKILDDLKYDTQYLEYFINLIGNRKF